MCTGGNTKQAGRVSGCFLRVDLALFRGGGATYMASTHVRPPPQKTDLPIQWVSRTQRRRIQKNPPLTGQGSLGMSAQIIFELPAPGLEIVSELDRRTVNDGGEVGTLDFSSISLESTPRVLASCSCGVPLSIYVLVLVLMHGALRTWSFTNAGPEVATTSFHELENRDDPGSGGERRL